MAVRPVVLQDPPKHPFPPQLPFNNSSRSLSPLESALTQVLILRHLKSFRMSTYTKAGGRDSLQAPKFVNSLLPPTTPQPDISATVTSPANPSLSIACGHFPSSIGVGGAAPLPDLKSYFRFTSRVAQGYRRPRNLPAFQLHSSAGFGVYVEYQCKGLENCR